MILSCICYRLGVQAGGTDNIYSAFGYMIPMIIVIIWGWMCRIRISQRKAGDCSVWIALFLIILIFLGWIRDHIVNEALSGSIDYAYGRNIIRFLLYGELIIVIGIAALSLELAVLSPAPSTRKAGAVENMISLTTMAIVALIMTNEIHHRVLSKAVGTIGADRMALYSDLELYGYKAGWGYYLAAQWCCACLVGAAGILAVYCLRKGDWNRLWFPGALMLISLIYLFFYAFGVIRDSFRIHDFSVVIAYLTMMVVESCIANRLIASVKGYEPFIRHSLTPMSIHDMEGNCLIRSDTFAGLESYISDYAEGDICILPGGRRMMCRTVRGGRVYWSEDITGAVRLIDELSNTADTLKDRNVTMREEYRSRYRKKTLEEKNRLYSLMQKDCLEYIRELQNLTRMLADTDDREEEKTLLERMTVIGTYVKRRNNLLFVYESGGRIPPGELKLSFLEMLSSLSALGVKGAINYVVPENMLFNHACESFDSFFVIILRYYRNIRSVYLSLGKEADHHRLLVELCFKEGMGPTEDDYASMEDEGEGIYLYSKEIGGAGL
ncbi:hypothetical protein [Butyrivibrio sp. MC2013]|uniref:hypothetical protein n=1 Tax=Butyrivibrio sp. MC2013 TaxID=1280686 RepID=UPI0018CBB8FE|nr:hypothetical protein [Butyrivibrio sp. MC2013]